VSWRKYLLIPRLAVAGLARTPRPDDAWDSFWRDVQQTGPDGDVLWDGAGEGELAWWTRTAKAYLDPTLPVVDVGCGNGRFTRLLAATFPEAVGIDVSAAAIARAEQESSGEAGVRYRRVDITTDGAGAALSSEVGPCNAVIRGVLHVLSDDERRAAVTNLAQLVHSGTLIMAETNPPGDALSYLEYLGARRGRLPAPLARLIDRQVPQPRSFGERQLAESFPARAWTTVASGAVELIPARSLGAHAARTIPGFYAVLRPAPGRSSDPV